MKPANILFESGHAILADFGVAHAVGELDEERLTKTGLTVGTPAYMSPEQAAGQKDLDGSSDQYALGCVLYEMLAGQPPFTGPTVASVISQHLTLEPYSIQGRRSTVSPHVSEALQRALLKTPADRFKTTSGFAAALRNPKLASGAHRRDVGSFVKNRGARLAAVVAGLGLVALTVLFSVSQRTSADGSSPGLFPVAANRVAVFTPAVSGADSARQ